MTDYRKEENNKDFFIIDGEEEEYKVDINPADILADLTGIPKEQLEFFIKEFSLKAVLQNPEITGLDDDKQEKLTRIKILLKLISTEVE